jgi:hypothetical protein
MKSSNLSIEPATGGFMRRVSFHFADCENTKMTMSENRWFIAVAGARLHLWNCPVVKSVIALCRVETPALMA